ncbi:hypothetical protein Tco_0169583 [Tanacetum coccineum]
MADMNIPTNDAPVEQAPAIAPPTRTDDQIFPLNKWVPIGKSNCVLDVQKSQRNPIFSIAVALLKITNFFRAFTTSSTVPAIYIQQFWDTMCFNSSTGLYSCQLDEQWFNLHKDLLRDALDITPTNDNNPLWIHLRVIQSSIMSKLRDTLVKLLDLTGQDILCFRSFGVSFIAPTLTMLKGFGKSLFVGKDGREIFGMPIPDALFTDDIKGAPYYDEYMEHVAKYQQHLDAEHGMEDEEGSTESPKATKVTKPKVAKVTKPAGDKAPKPTSSQPPKPTPAQTKPSKKDQAKAGKVTKKRMPKSYLQLVDEFVNEGVTEKEPAHDDK